MRSLRSNLLFTAVVAGGIVALLAFSRSCTTRERPDAHSAKPGWATGPSLREAIIKEGGDPAESVED